MGIQLASLTHAVVQQDIPREKPPPLPMERRVLEKQAEVPIPGAPKPVAIDLKKTASNLEQISLAFNRRLQFIVDQDSREIIIKVIDNETDKVIKVLPPEELQRLHSRIRETMGFLFDEMV